jgi:hypothetical protein
MTSCFLAVLTDNQGPIIDDVDGSPPAVDPSSEDFLDLRQFFTALS